MAEGTTNPLTLSFYGDEGLEQFIETYFVGVKAKLTNGKLELSGADSIVKIASTSFFRVDVDVHRKQLIIAEKSTLQFLNDQIKKNKDTVILVTDKQDVYMCILSKNVRRSQLKMCRKLVEDNINFYKFDKSLPNLNSVIEKILFKHQGKVIGIPSGEPMLVFTKDIEESIRNQLDEAKKGLTRHHVVQTTQALCDEDAFQSFLKKNNLSANKDSEMEVHDLQLDSRKEPLILTDDTARSFVNKKLSDNQIACYLTPKEGRVVGITPPGYQNDVKKAIALIHDNVDVIEFKDNDSRGEIPFGSNGKITTVVQEQRTFLVFTKDIEKEVVSFLKEKNQNEATKGSIKDKSSDHKDQEGPIKSHDSNKHGTPSTMPSHDNIRTAQNEKKDVPGNIMKKQNLDPESDTKRDRFNSQRESKDGHDSENETKTHSFNLMKERESKAKGEESEDETKQINENTGRARQSCKNYSRKTDAGLSDEEDYDAIEMTQMDTYLARYLFAYKKSEVENLEKQFGCNISNDKGAITIVASGRHGNKRQEPQISSKGRRVIEKVNDLAQLYCMTSFHVEEENLTAFSGAVNRLHSKAKDTQVTTVHCYQPKIVETFVIKGVYIHLVQGSAVDVQQADAILCPLGSKFNPECAAADQIISKGGDSLKEILTIYANNRKRWSNLSFENVQTTGDLPFRALCGMVFEDWYTKTKPDESKIQAKLKEAFDDLVAIQRSSISVPLEVGQRIPVMSMAKAWCTAVKSFTSGRPSSVLKTISLCVVNDACIQPLSNLLRKEFQPVPKTEPSPSSDVASSTDIYGPSTVHVSLKNGSLTDQEVEAIVVPTSEKLDLSKGLISRSVQKAAGESIEIELKAKNPQGIGPMEVTYTGPGKLQLKSILYSNLPRMDAGYGSPEMCVGILMTNIFKLAKELKITSIALPAIGTGGLKYPDDVVAMEIVRSIYLLASTHGITNVTIVVYEQSSDQHKIFKKAVGEYQNSVQMTCKALNDSPSFLEVVNEKRGNRYTILESNPEVAMCDVMIVHGEQAHLRESDEYNDGDNMYVRKVEENLSRGLLRAKIYLAIPSYELDNSHNKELYLKALQCALKDLNCQFLVIKLESCEDIRETVLIIDRFLKKLDDLLDENSRLSKVQFLVSGETLKSLMKNVKDQDHGESQSLMKKFKAMFKSSLVWRLVQPKCHISSGAYVTVCSDHEESMGQLVYALKSSVQSHEPHARGMRLDDKLSTEGRTKKTRKMYPKHSSQKQDESETFSDLPKQRQSFRDGHSRRKSGSPDRSHHSDSSGDFYEDAEEKLFEEYSGVLPTSTVCHMSSRKINEFMKLVNGKTMKADLVEDEIKIKIPHDKTTELAPMLKTVLSDLDKTVYYIHDVNPEINHLLELHFKKMGCLDQGDWRYLPSEEKIEVNRYEDVYNQVRLTVLALKKYQYQMDTLDVSKTKLSLKDTLQSFKDQEEFKHVLVEPTKDSQAINIHYPIDQQAQAVKVKNWLQVKLELIRTTGRRNRRFDNYTSLQNGGQEIVNNAGTTSSEAAERPKEELSGRSIMRPDRPLYSSSLSMPAPQKEPLQGFIGHTKEMHDDSTEAIYCTEKKLVIKVYKGDIKNLKVDCIVNAANEDLFHGAGIAAVIARAAGRDFDRECRNFIRDNGKLHVNQCISTTAGKLSYRYVLHAVGPMWGMYKEKSDCEDDLMQTIVNILRRAECLDMKSVAIPSISSGIFGVPWNVCAEQYARGVCKFEEVSKGVLKEVHFIDINEDILKEVRSVFNLTFQVQTSSNFRESF